MILSFAIGFLMGAALTFYFNDADITPKLAWVGVAVAACWTYAQDVWVFLT